MSKRKNPDLSNQIDSLKIIVHPKNKEQEDMLSIISENIITFVKGFPGTGKTYISVAYALQELVSCKYDKIIFTRPTIEAAGEKLGFLPGDMYDKIDPYMMPIFEVLMDLLPGDVCKKMISKNGESIIRVLPLAFMRGVTFRRSLVICDESQNATSDQIRMLLTRTGSGSKVIVCGDIRQSDIMGANGLEDAFDILQGIEGIGFVTLTEKAVVRDPIIRQIEERYINRGVKNEYSACSQMPKTT